MRREETSLTSDNRLDTVYWIGGGSGAGKSTIGRRLAARYGAGLYATDDVMADHARRSHPEDSPLLAAFKTMDMDERWLNCSPKAMLESFHWFKGEGFNLIIEDLQKLAQRGRVIVEGFRLLPHLVRPHLGRLSQAVWLLPAPEFRVSALESRGGLWSIAEQTSDPHKALDNLLKRDALFTEQLRKETRELGLPVIEVDSTLSEDALENLVATQFAFTG